MTIFIRLLDEPTDQKAISLSESCSGRRGVHIVDASKFSQISGSPFAYWASAAVMRCTSSYPSLESEERHAAAGANTRDNPRFLRLAWEINPDNIVQFGASKDRASAWVLLTKGGKHNPFYANVHLVVRWPGEGRELKAAASAWRASKGWGEQWTAVLNGYDYYGRPGISWPVRSQTGFSARAFGQGGIFGHKGPTLFLDDDSDVALEAMLAIMNSAPFKYFISLQMAFGAYEVGVIQRTPVPELSPNDRTALATLARRAWSLKRNLDTANEASSAFVLPGPLLTLRTGVDAVQIEAEIGSIQTEIDDLAFRLYGLEGQDRAEIEIWASKGKDEIAETSEEDGSSEPDSDAEDDDEETNTDAVGSVHSWALGVAFGRFDLRLATGDRELPSEPGPFSPLPVVSPGMLPKGDPMFHVNNGILVEDPGHPDDVTSIVASIFETTKISYVGGADTWTLRFGETSSGLFMPEVYRAWLRRQAFPAHIKMYSKSRRKAPIYWRLGTASGSYAVWLYIHKFTKDTLFRVQNDYVAPKLAHEQRQLDALKSDAGSSPSATQRKAIDAQVAFVEEIQIFFNELKRVAPLWNPDLDDGVIINSAPLWRLVAHNKPWQKELRTAWEALQRGDFDWSHLAMHLWPERVVPKCVTDRSLAIAHELEDVFWFEDESGKWKPRKTPTHPVSELVGERTSDAVKAALKDLLSASEPAGGTRRGRRKV
ncbi:type II restriction endonuclease subunit M [Microvirga tunisiensis]|uniref:Type II restriction endonuclease subunit M n=1 Tax=Microvirga tunisiensis TaxID=2108360 RepID=A0A5N7MAY4_9HYPH|nr:type II restriction endonuclease subunit M [Microvirga tunisiensis]MPR06287.1 type II restriction endonuclease subunit M [Microvirga tunisiensis]MPR24073.1 type II restriction endonuclease subunit M [Microvirga tunisiensis]